MAILDNSNNDAALHYEQATESSSEDDEDDQLFGDDVDPIIPSQADIERIYRCGLATWSSFVAAAAKGWPKTLHDPSIMLNNIPALPRAIPTGGLYGRPVWRTPGLDWEEALGIGKTLQLSFSKPIRCKLSAQHDSASEIPRGFAILVLLWAYILSARLLERRGRRIRYSCHRLQPQAVDSRRISLDLSRPASPKLVRWICAVLSPKLGWHAEEGELPPWAALCDGDVQFSISTDTPIGADEAPSSSEARELLTEFCLLFGLTSAHEHEPMSPCTAAFMGALALPFYRDDDLRPQLMVPPLKRNTGNDPAVQDGSPIEQLYSDLPYYMTLSMHPISVGSMLWSIFWQPDIPCNLVSPWLQAIHDTIRPILEKKDAVFLGKLFSHRRQRISIMWLGIFFLGDPTIFDRISRYLETLEERPHFSSTSPPDISVAAWTGSAQSFVDLNGSQNQCSDTIARADILRGRYNFRLSDTRHSTLSWRPFGDISAHAIEPDLRGYLKCGCTREYQYWVWYRVEDADAKQHGFKKDTGRYTPTVWDNLNLKPPEDGRPGTPAFKLAPSKKATLLMIDHSVEEISGDRSLEIAVIPGLSQKHRWLCGWRGLSSNSSW